MQTFILLLIVASIAYLALSHKPQQHSTAELKNWFSKALSDIAANIEKDIEKDIRGEYPHAGMQTFSRRGMITYVIIDKDYRRFDILDNTALTSRDITQTEGYKMLIARIRELSLSILLEEINVDGDGVESFNELDEYTFGSPRYYTVTISGW